MKVLILCSDGIGSKDVDGEDKGDLRYDASPQ